MKKIDFCNSKLKCVRELLRLTETEGASLSCDLVVVGDEERGL